MERKQKNRIQKHSLCGARLTGRQSMKSSDSAAPDSFLRTRRDETGNRREPRINRPLHLSKIRRDAFDFPIAVTGRIKSAAAVYFLRATRLGSNTRSTAGLRFSERALGSVGQRLSCNGCGTGARGIG